MLATRLSLCALFVALGSTAFAQNVRIISGQVVQYDTARGPVTIDSLVIEPGGTLRVIGDARFRLLARRGVIINGLLDVSGFHSDGVGTLNTAHIREPGAAGGPGGGEGGGASRMSHTSTARGEDGTGQAILFFGRGGGGGESGYQFQTGAVDERRAAGGGGGIYAADQPANLLDPNAPENIGLVAQPGMNGSPQARGATSGVLIPRGGLVGELIFVDAQTDNDFFGRKAVGGGILVGELPFPLPGRGGGGGGDAIPSASFPSMPFTPRSDEKGAGGGGGGGLGIIVAPYIIVGSSGQLRADGGNGGGGENTFFFNRVGGGSGAGSGGALILQARVVDLSQASAKALTALGGLGGPGRNQVRGAIGAGGDGGPGVIQIHVLNPAMNLRLPAGVGLDALTSPQAHVLLPSPSL